MSAERLAGNGVGWIALSSFGMVWLGSSCCNQGKRFGLVGRGESAWVGTDWLVALAWTPACEGGMVWSGWSWCGLSTGWERAGLEWIALFVRMGLAWRVWEEAEWIVVSARRGVEWKVVLARGGMKQCVVSVRHALEGLVEGFGPDCRQARMGRVRTVRSGTE